MRLDRGNTGELKLLQLRLTRAGCARIHLHATRFFSPRPDGLSTISQVLEPYLDSLDSLDLIVTDNRSSLPLHIFERFARSCTPGSSKSLALFAASSSLPAEKFRHPLTLCEGLISLQLHRLPNSVVSTYDQLADLLSRNPALRTLQLNKLPHILLPDQLGRLKSVSLPDLSLLDMIATHSLVTELLLLMLVPGNLELRLRLSISDRQEMISASVEFLRRSRVKVLYATKIESPCLEWFTQCSPFLQQLRTLVLNAGGVRGSINYTALGAGESAPLLPSLQTVCLERVVFDHYSLNQLQKALGVYSLSRLIFINCDISSLWATRSDVIEQFSPHVGEVLFLDSPGWGDLFWNSLD